MSNSRDNLRLGLGLGSRSRLGAGDCRVGDFMVLPEIDHSELGKEPLVSREPGQGIDSLGYRWHKSSDKHRPAVMVEV